LVPTPCYRRNDGIEQESVVLLGDLIEGVATDTRQPKAIVEAIVRDVLAWIEGAVGKGQTVNLVGFGRFEVYERSARRGRNLRTGESLKIPATKAVRFKVGKRLRESSSCSRARAKAQWTRARRPCSPHGLEETELDWHQLLNTGSTRGVLLHHRQLLILGQPGR
jgi:DNA-binding protein HU-beta